MSANYIWTELPADDVLEQLDQMSKEGCAAVSGFLDTHQWSPLAGNPRISLDGGHADAQFRRASLGDGPLSVAFFHIRPELLPDNAKGGRGVRAWLDRHGVAPNSIGDIAAGRHICLAAVPGALDGLPMLEAQAVNDWSPPEITVERVSVAGERLDALLGAVFRVSRNEAQTALKHGFVFKNFEPAVKRTKGFQSGDQIVFRTKGRAEIVATGENVRSGRLWVELRRFPA